MARCHMDRVLYILIGRGTRVLEKRRTSPRHQRWTPPSLWNLFDLCTHGGGAPPHPAGDHSESPPSHPHILPPDQPVLLWRVDLLGHCPQNADDLGLPREAELAPFTAVWLSSTSCTPWETLSHVLGSWPGRRLPVQVWPAWRREDMRPTGHKHVAQGIPVVCCPEKSTFCLICCGCSRIEHRSSSNWPVQTHLTTDHGLPQRPRSTFQLLPRARLVPCVHACAIPNTCSSKGRCRASRTCASPLFFVLCVAIYLRPDSKHARAGPWQFSTTCWLRV